MSSIVEGATKSNSKLRKLEHQSRNRFQTKLCLENRFFFQKLQKKTFSKSKKWKQNDSVIKKFETKVPEKQTNSIQMSYIAEDVTKSISKWRKLEHQTRNRFQTKLCLENCFFVQKMQEKFF